MFTIMQKKKPVWTPKNAGKEFASNVLPAIEAVQNHSHIKPHKPRSINIQELYEGVIGQNRTFLSKAITLIESNSPRHFDFAQQLVKLLLPYSGNSIRIGITGTPGAGKSTFIESFGIWLIEHGHKVAVLAIDPSSSISKGSILGDKTRMEELSRKHESFIRPSPSGGVLGGVARKTRESIILCEAAGYDVILIETVGVGQSEITVRSMVDFFLLMQISGAGDELQGIKKGIMELADLILVNKADGDNLLKAQTAASELNNVLHYIQNATPYWNTKALICSALEKQGLSEVWDLIQSFMTHVKSKGLFEKRRNQQSLDWFDEMLKEALFNEFFAKETLLGSYHSLKKQIEASEVSPAAAVQELLAQYHT